MATSGQRRIGAFNYPPLSPDDLLNDELPDYSSRRSSYNDQKPNLFDPESRKVSTASNTLEVPGGGGWTLADRQNSMTSLVSNSSANTFSYRNLTKPKIKNAFGSLIAFLGLAILVLGVLFLIFGHRLSLDNVVTIDTTSTEINGTNSTTSGNEDDNSPQYRVSAIETIGYFALFFGILLILIAISIICLEVKPIPKPNPIPNFNLKRKVSTIEIEPLPPTPELTTNKPEIMITTDNFKDTVTYKKYPNPTPNPNPNPNPNPRPDLEPRASFSLDYESKPRNFDEYQKRFPY